MTIFIWDHAAFSNLSSIYAQTFLIPLRSVLSVSSWCCGISNAPIVIGKSTVNAYENIWERVPIVPPVVKSGPHVSVYRQLLNFFNLLILIKIIELGEFVLFWCVILPPTLLKWEMVGRRVRLFFVNSNFSGNTIHAPPTRQHCSYENELWERKHS